MRHCDAANTSLLSVIEALARTDRASNDIALLVYLMDWRAALDERAQITSHKWRIDVRGPRTREIEDMVLALRAEKRPLLKILFPTPVAALAGITARICAAIEKVIDQTAPLSRTELRRLVMSTYPVTTASAEDARDVADLCALALAYRETVPA